MCPLVSTSVSSSTHTSEWTDPSLQGVQRKTTAGWPWLLFPGARKLIPKSVTPNQHRKNNLTLSFSLGTLELAKKGQSMNQIKNSPGFSLAQLGLSSPWVLDFGGQRD
jgi:hypothetical protein